MTSLPTQNEATRFRFLTPTTRRVFLQVSCGESFWLYGQPDRRVEAVGPCLGELAELPPLIIVYPSQTNYRRIEFKFFIVSTRQAPEGGGWGGGDGGGGGLLCQVDRDAAPLRRNYAFSPILMKNRGRNTTFSSFLLRYGGGLQCQVSDRDAQHRPSTQNPTRVKKGGSKLFSPILMKNRGRNATFSSFLLKKI